VGVERHEINQLLAIADKQHNLVTASQAAEAGLTLPMLEAATRHGWLGQQRRGVYVVGGAAESRWRPLMAAILVASPRAAVSHGSAAMVHHFSGVNSDLVELIVTAGVRCNLLDVRVHQTRTLKPDDVEVRRGVRVTSPIRTIIDIADRFDEHLLGKIVDEGVISRLWTVEAIAIRLSGVRHGVAGIAPLRRLVAERMGEGNPDSELEQRVIRVLKRIPAEYVVHHQEVLDGQVIVMDIAWVGDKIDGEVDGMWARSSSRTKFESERARANILARHGWRIVHFTAKMDDDTLIGQVAPLLGLDRSTGTKTEAISTASSRTALNSTSSTLNARSSTSVAR
jgi:hypothetical protein